LNVGYNPADQLTAVTNGATWVTYQHYASARPFDDLLASQDQLIFIDSHSRLYLHNSIKRPSSS
jgi:hypothetical protein